MARRSNTARQRTFATVPSVEIPRSSLNRSCGHKTVLFQGYLTPVFRDDVLPGDTMAMSATAFGRIATLIRPIMENVYLDFFWFFVPNRLVWTNWQRFMGERDPDPDSSIEYTVPQIEADGGGFDENELMDYLGVPPGVANLSVSALYSRGYNLIWNEWFRDQNLQDSLTVDKDDGPDAEADYVCVKRGKRHDYFTSALPWPQKGDSVSLPLGDVAPVVGEGTGVPTFDYGAVTGDNLLSGSGVAGFGPGSGTGDPVSWNDTALEADLSSATAATINEIREAFQVQKLLERDARGGTRYVELVKSHFGVTSPDARLQRPEYLGGGSIRVMVNQVAQTSQSDSTKQANLAGFGTAAGGNGFVKSFTEHGFILGLVASRADLNYQEGVHRDFYRRSRYDYYWPAFSHLGEQTVMNGELFATGVGDPDLQTGDYAAWGYQERHAEYRYKPSMVSSRMRSSAAVPLDPWHLAQEFGSLPALNASFIEEDAPYTRIKAVNAEADFILDCWFDYKCARPMPVYGVPGLIDHF